MSATSADSILVRPALALAAALARPGWCAPPTAPPRAPRPCAGRRPRSSTELYESSPTFSRDGRELYFFRADRRFGNYRLLQSRCIDGRWSAPRGTGVRRARGHAGGRSRARARRRACYYVSRARARAHEYGRPRHLVRRTPCRRCALGRTAAIAGAGQFAVAGAAAASARRWAACYFGSSRAGGHGQGDIYIATPRREGGWRVDNAGPPISTAANEYEAELSRDGKVMVVVADRGDRSHLYVHDRRGDAWVERGRVPARATCSRSDRCCRRMAGACCSRRPMANVPASGSWSTCVPVPTGAGLRPAGDRRASRRPRQACAAGKCDCANRRVIAPAFLNRDMCVEGMIRLRCAGAHACGSIPRRMSLLWRRPVTTMRIHRGSRPWTSPHRDRSPPRSFASCARASSSRISAARSGNWSTRWCRSPRCGR